MIKDKDILFAIGQLTLALSLLLHRFANESGMISFIIGACTGLSIVCNIAFLIRYRNEKTTGASAV